VQQLGCISLRLYPAVRLLHLLNTDIPNATVDDSANLNVSLTLAQCHFVTGALEQGIDLLAEAYAKELRPDVVLMYARALANRSTDGDLQKTIDIILKVGVGALPPATQALFSVAALQHIAKKGDWSAAQAFVEKAQLVLDEAAMKALKGFVHHGRGEVNDANVSANDALRSVTDDTDAGVREFLAGLLMQLGRPTDALPIRNFLISASLHLNGCRKHWPTDRQTTSSRLEALTRFALSCWQRQSCAHTPGLGPSAHQQHHGVCRNKRRSGSRSPAKSSDGSALGATNSCPLLI
jgi:hypothetical protein